LTPSVSGTPTLVSDERLTMGRIMHADRFRKLLSAKGPYASVYFDDSHDTEDAAAQLDIKLRELRSQLDDQGADAAVSDRIERAVRGSSPPVGKSGRAIVLGSEDVVLDEVLVRPAPSPLVRVSELPYVVPVVEYGYERPTYVVVAVDHAGGDIEVHHDGRVRKETVDGEGYPVHKASGAETSGYGDPQRGAENARGKNVASVADRVTALADELSPEVVFIVGEVQSRSDLMADLPERVADRCVEVNAGARTSIDEHQLHDAISDQIERKHFAAVDDVADRFTAELGRGSGLATEGLAGVTAALRGGAVETLIIGDMGEATVVAGDDLATVSPNADVLSQLGEAPQRVLRADEALPMVAISTSASLVPAAARLKPADGVGAILRYSVT
jgi:Bacterial archaeo-eukaryotic release factor family 2